MTGRLVYLIGPSGAGKDTLLDHLRRVWPQPAPFVIAHRYITRQGDAGGENHVALGDEEFALRRELGLFAVSWTSHGFSYGVGVEVEAWMRAGAHVVVNGSRGALPSAARRFPTMIPVLLHVPPDVLRERLAARGRESAEQVEARLRRTVKPIDHPGLVVVQNSGPIEEAVAAMLDVLTGL